MICTEEEAKKKWCPHIRYEGEEQGGSWNAGIDGNDRINAHTVSAKFIGKYECNCIASACMMWEWTGTIGRDAETGEEVPDILGFCGLTGTKP